MDGLRIARWHLGLGAEVLPEGVRFRVWAPKRRQVEVVVENLDGLIVPLEGNLVKNPRLYPTR